MTKKVVNKKQIKIVEDVPKPVEKAAEKKRVAFYRAYLFEVYVIVATAGFFALAIFASRFAYFPIDLRITRTIQQINIPFFDTLMRFVSDLGYHPTSTLVTIAIIAGLLLIRLYWEALVAASAMVISVNIVQLIKGQIARPRPAEELVKIIREVTDYSFPSGHVLTYTVFFGFLWFLSFSLLKPSKLRTVLLIVFGGLVLMVGPSRIYLGAHWASDTLGAYLLGSSLLAIFIQVYRWGQKRHFFKHSK